MVALSQLPVRAVDPYTVLRVDWAYRPHVI